MATNNDPHTPLAARLSSADARYILEFVLKPLIESTHEDWHSYEIHMIDAGSGRRWSLTASDSLPLFLDKAIEPEVPALCSGLRKVVATGEAYRFAPIDERDFVLDAAAVNGTIRLQIQYDWAPAPPEFGWPAGLIVDSREVLRFANELEASFEKLFRAHTGR